MANRVEKKAQGSEKHSEMEKQGNTGPVCQAMWTKDTGKQLVNQKKQASGED